MKSYEVAAFIDNFAQNPAQDIPSEFLEQLRRYADYVEEYDLKRITREFDFIPKNIEKLIANPYLCVEPQVSDLLTEVLLKFVTKRDDAKDPVTLWAANLLRKFQKMQKKGSNKSRSKAQLMLKSIYQYPKEYFQSLTNEKLSTIALSNPPQQLILYLLEELENRKLEIPPKLIQSIDITSNRISPSLMVSIFQIYIESPTLQFAELLVQAINNRPFLHVLFTSDLSFYEIPVIRNALSLLGSVISKFNFSFPLSYIYPPQISDLAYEIKGVTDPVSKMYYDVFASILQDYNDTQIQFLFPLILEFPHIGKCLFDIDERIQAMLAGWQ